MREKKKRLAIWTPGAIGNGNFSQGYPMIEKLLWELSDEFDIVVYSKTRPNDGYTAKLFQLKYPPAFVKGKLCWVILFFYFLKDRRENKFDILFAFFGYPAGFIVTVLGKLFRIPSVVNVLGADSASIESIQFGIFHRRFPRLISTWAYLNASVLLAISNFQKEQLKGFSIKRDIQVIPWGADQSMYIFSLKTPGEVLRVIHVGHINPVKDQTTLLKAFALILKKQRAKLKIFGLDGMDGAMQKFCVELEIEEHVEFCNMLPYYKMPEHFQEADIMLHTSLSEGQCMALTEAAACGVLMAGTRVGILYDLGEEYGITVGQGEYELLAGKVLTLLNEPVEWSRRVDNARKWSDAHNLSWTVSELSRLLRGLM